MEFAKRREGKWATVGYHYHWIELNQDPGPGRLYVLSERKDGGFLRLMQDVTELMNNRRERSLECVF